MGRGDIKTKRGKISSSSFGKHRLKKTKKLRAARKAATTEKKA